MSKPTKRKKTHWTKNDTELTIMALPTTIWYILFCFLPMFGLIIAFKNYKVIGGKSFIYNLIHSEWAGVKNFMFLIKSSRFVRNSAKYDFIQSCIYCTWYGRFCRTCNYDQPDAQ